MLGNIIGQDNVINLLKNDFIKKSFNNSMIFHGEESTGKLTTALELTRVLNCIYQAESECQCSNCMRIRSLDFEGLIFLSRRNFYFYLKEYIETYKNTKNHKYFENIKNIIKLIFLPLQDYLVKDVFSEPDKKVIVNESEKVSKIISKNEFNSTDLEEIQNTSKEIFELYKKPNIPIDTIRGMLDWTYINRPDINKVVIIDQVDFLEESSRNILLKRLEEPSPNLFFILIAENKNRIIETIKSRCRSYYFQKLSSEKTMEILSTHFEEQSRYNSVKDFLFRSDEKSKINIYPVIVKLLNYVFQKEHGFPELNNYLQGFKDRKYVKAILYETCSILEKEIKERELELNNEAEIKSIRNITYFNLKLLVTLIKDKYNKIDKFGLNPTLTLEGIFYPIKSMVQNDKI